MLTPLYIYFSHIVDLYPYFISVWCYCNQAVLKSC